MISRPENLRRSIAALRLGHRFEIFDAPTILTVAGWPPNAADRDANRLMFEEFESFVPLLFQGLGYSDRDKGARPATARVAMFKVTVVQSRNWDCPCASNIHALQPGLQLRTTDFR